MAIMRRTCLLPAALAGLLLASCTSDAAWEATDDLQTKETYTATGSTPSVSRAAGFGDAVPEDVAGPADAAIGDAPPVQAIQVAPDMIIRTGSARVRVDTLERAVAAVRVLAAEVGGYVANAEIQSGRAENRHAALQLRVPAVSFDRLTEGLAPLGRVESVNVSTQDVGEEYTDVAARLENARRLEERLQRILDARTGNLAEVLAVERELARIRGEAERLEGRLRYLRSRVAVSTFTLHLFEPGPLVGDRPGANPIVSAVQRSVRNFVAVIVFLIEAAGVVIPVGLLMVGGWWILRRLRPRRPHGEPTPFGPVPRREPAAAAADETERAE
jgi:hypothetical protein